MDQNKIGAFIARHRKEKNMTQKQLGEQLGVLDKSVSKWERGICLPDVSLFQPLCEILDVSLNELFMGEDIPKEKQAEEMNETFTTLLKQNQKITKVKKIICILSIVLMPLIILQKKLYFIWIELNSDFSAFR